MIEPRRNWRRVKTGKAQNDQLFFALHKSAPARSLVGSLVQLRGIVAGSIGFSGLLARGGIGHPRIGSAGKGRIRSAGKAYGVVGRRQQTGMRSWTLTTSSLASRVMIANVRVHSPDGRPSVLSGAGDAASSGSADASLRLVVRTGAGCGLAPRFRTIQVGPRDLPPGR
jgi:hypothetical protein